MTFREYLLWKAEDPDADSVDDVTRFAKAMVSEHMMPALPSCKSSRERLFRDPGAADLFRETWAAWRRYCKYRR
jgi:hypothetical protein